MIVGVVCLDKERPAQNHGPPLQLSHINRLQAVVGGGGVIRHSSLTAKGIETGGLFK
jgi:hypothetical protein